MPHPGVFPPLAKEYVHAVLLKINMSLGELFHHGAWWSFAFEV